jgi:hypothetical protein
MSMSDTTDNISAAERRRLLIAQKRTAKAPRGSGRFGTRPLDAMSAVERRRILIERKAAAKAQRERAMRWLCAASKRLAAQPLRSNRRRSA